MKVAYSKNLIKQAKKLDSVSRQKLYERILLFTQNPLDARLRTHGLKGKYKAYRSIDITGDLRALYIQEGDEVIFDTVGTHSQLYG